MAGVRFHRQSCRGVRGRRLAGEKRWRLEMEKNRKGKVSRARGRTAPGHFPQGGGGREGGATGETRFQMGGQSSTAGRSDGFSGQRRCGSRGAVQVSVCVAVRRWNDEWRMTNDERGPNEEVRAQLTWPRTRRRTQPPPGQQRRQQPRLARGLVPCSDELWVRSDGRYYLAGKAQWQPRSHSSGSSSPLNCARRLGLRRTFDWPHFPPT